MQSEDPRQVGRYQLLGRLGAGGMGEVFLGQSPGGRLVAVKLIRGELAADREFRVRFAREVAAARHVSGMFTAPVVDADLDAPRPWLVTAYVPGPSLAEAVDTQGPLPLSSVLTLAAGLAEGLEAIHAEGMVHRDLKPSNVLLASDGPRIIDFGISRAADATALTRANIFVGSPGYMSPEQAMGEEVGPASDIFSLGAVLTFAAAGASPFGDGTVTTLLYRVAHDRPATEGLPGQLRPLVERCLAKDPRMRPTPDQLLAELGTVDAGTNWLPQPVAETLIGYARPVADTTIPPAQPSPAPAPPAAAPSAPAPPAPAPSAPAPAASVPPIADPSAPAPSLGAPRAPTPATVADARPPAPPPADFFEGLYRKGPPPKRPDVGRVPSTTTPLGWQSDLARPPRRRRRLGRVLAAGALVLVLAAAGVAALALTSRLHLGSQPTPPTSSSPAVASPRAVVEAYIAAINAHQWRKVWNLGGKNFGQSYGQMVSGYRTTARDVLTSIHAHGDVVTVRLRAHHTDGKVLTFRISYTVQDGVITGAHTKRLRTG
ncbi:MAG TPA: serine/threonine-protein kinase [Candidatus Eisenbacteria bacterium]|nr:serine/threonine-protein kinase [Candidatus Eisenbacteria bacterium]